MSKQVEAQQDGVINPQNYNFGRILQRIILMLSHCYESTEIYIRNWLHVPFWTYGPPAETLTKYSIQKDTFRYFDTQF